MRVYVKQDDGVAADEGHAPGLTGQILLEVRGIKALARRWLFFYFFTAAIFTDTVQEELWESVCVCVCVCVCVRHSVFMSVE